MNAVILKINPEKVLNTISVNGNPLSLYSELNNFMKEPFSSWYDKLFDCLDRELNDDFSLTVVSNENEANILKELSKQHESCIEFKYEPFAADLPIILKSYPDKLEVGESFKLLFVTENDKEVSNIRAQVLKDNVVSCDGKHITAIGIGSTDIEFYKSEELIPFEKIHVSVYKNNFIERIELSVENAVLGVNMSEPLDIKVFPPDADDATRLEIFVEDDTVANLSADGKILTLSEGTTTITAKGELVETSIEIKVLPDLSQIFVDKHVIKCFVGEVIPINVTTEPKDVFDNEYSWTSSDNSVAIVEKDEEGNECIRATGIGHATLKCNAAKGDAYTQMDVFVDSTILRSKREHRLLKIMMYIFLAMIVAIAFDAMKVLYGLVILLYITGVITIITEKSSRFGAILILAIPTCILIHDYLLM